MNSTHHATERENTFLSRVSKFLQKYRKIFLYGFIAFVVILVGFIIYTEWRKSVNRTATALVETAQSEYEQWVASEDEGNEEQADELIADLNDVIDRYPNTYAAQRAYFMLGNIWFARENWQESADAYAALAGNFSESYLAPLSLFNAAAAYENAQDTENAVTAYQQIVDEYGEAAPQTPHALFSLGRIADTSGDYPEARTYYDRLIDEYPGSSWTNLARNRIIFLTAQGSLQGE